MVLKLQTTKYCNTTILNKNINYIKYKNSIMSNGTLAVDTKTMQYYNFK